MGKQEEENREGTYQRQLHQGQARLTIPHDHPWDGVVEGAEGRRQLEEQDLEKPLNLDN
jgi:hypothetical protein